ncbi:MAG TPA: hypothetical protein VED63_09255, partial [Acidimicrobiales bacterium]|nr:hypothetical protein [Acidimicrobiales bacterium]
MEKLPPRVRVDGYPVSARPGGDAVTDTKGRGRSELPWPVVDEPGQPRIVAFVGRRIRSRVSATGTTTGADSADALAARPDPALARRFGVDGFCYPCRLVAGSAVFGGGTTGPGPTPGPGLFPFLLCWEVDQGVPTGVEAADAERDGHDVALVDLFAHREYIRRGERPVVVVLEHDDADGGRSTVATWRRRWHASGAPDPFLVALDHRSDPGGDSAATPYDAVINVPRSAVHDGPESTGA